MAQHEVKNTDKFVSSVEDLEVIKPQCHTCKRWNKDLTCEAFPAGIPAGILMNAIDHKKKVPGDGGLTYEAKD